MNLTNHCSRGAIAALLLVALWADAPGAASQEQQPATGNTAVVRQGDDVRTSAEPWTPQMIRALWDMKEMRNTPLDVELVSTRTKDGYRTDEMYFTSRVTPKGTDRIFCTFSRPLDPEPRVPAYIDLTGGRDLAGVMWLAQHYRCAVLDIEWRSPLLKHRTRWADEDAHSKNIFSVTDRAENNFNYALVTAIRRGIDLLDTQPGIDRTRIVCGGGSMGGWYSLLTAGLDRRVRYVFDVYAAGDGVTNSLDSLTPEGRRWWTAIFDPMSFASATRAATLMYLGTNDFFFALDHGIKNYNRLTREKRLLLVPNFNHNIGAFGKEDQPDCGKTWIDHCLHGDPALPTVTDPTAASGGTYAWRATGPYRISAARLYWSPGKAVWPARYWVEIPAVARRGGWEASIPKGYEGLSGNLFATVVDQHGRAVSSRVVSRSGSDPERVAGPLWLRGNLWDVERGASAWRRPGAGPDNAFWSVDLEPLGESGLSVTSTDVAGKFCILSNSVTLASGQALQWRGIRIVIRGGGHSGGLTIALERNSASWSCMSYDRRVDYGPGTTVVEIPWSEFRGPAGAPATPYPFDGLCIRGDRERGAPLMLDAIELYR